MKILWMRFFGAGLAIVLGICFAPDFAREARAGNSLAHARSQMLVAQAAVDTTPAAFATNVQSGADTALAAPGGTSQAVTAGTGSGAPTEKRVTAYTLP